MKKAMLLVFGLALLSFVQIYAQNVPKPTRLENATLETETIKPERISWFRANQVVMKIERGNSVPKNVIDNSEWLELFARLGVVVWDKEPLSDEARRRTIARANSNRPDTVNFVIKTLDMTIAKQAIATWVSRQNDHILAGNTPEKLRQEIEALKSQHNDDVSLMKQMQKDINDLKAKSPPKP